MERINKILSQYGLNLHDVIQREELLLQFSRESFIALVHNLKDTEINNNPDIYEIIRSIKKIYNQINDNESKTNSNDLQDVIENHFLKIGLVKNSEELAKDKTIFMGQLLEISKKHFDYENTIEIISRKDYPKILIDKARESFLVMRLEHFLTQRT